MSTFLGWFCIGVFVFLVVQHIGHLIYKNYSKLD